MDLSHTYLIFGFHYYQEQRYYAAVILNGILYVVKQYGTHYVHPSINGNILTIDATYSSATTNVIVFEIY